MSHKFCKIPEGELTQEMVDACINTSINTTPVYGGYAILKYSGSKPAELASYDELDTDAVNTFITPYLPTGDF